MTLTFTTGWYVFPLDDVTEPLAGPFDDHEDVSERADAFEAEGIATEVALVNEAETALDDDADAYFDRCND